ncbi:MAG: hypothetical protein MUE81_13740 [Thermoflexibacter sp.]|nr:hypothetical protein [Thermoflexibacter sp.]
METAVMEGEVLCICALDLCVWENAKTVAKRSPYSTETANGQSYCRFSAKLF